jgi:transposase
VERNTGFPIFFRYVAGNIVDVSTLRVTLNLMKAYGIDIHHSILDAGYSSEANLLKLLEDGIPFLIRLPDNKATKNYIELHGKDVICETNSFKYGERRMFMKREIYNVANKICYAYIAVDFERQYEEQKKHFDRFESNKNDKKKKSFNEYGYFLLHFI